MMNGWIKINRAITEHWLWQDAERLKWWFDLLFLAAWEDKQQLVGKQLVSLQRGQLIASLSFLCKRWGRSRSMVESFLNLLQKDGMISKKANNNIAVISVLNYEKYQTTSDAYLDAYLETSQNTCKSNGLERAKANVDAYLEAHHEAYPDAHLCAYLDAYLDAYLKQAVTLENTEGCGSKAAPVNAYLNAPIDAPIDATNKEYILTTTSSNAHARESKDLKFVEELKGSQFWLEQMAMNFYISTDEIKNRLDKFYLDCKCRGTEHQNLNDTRRHFNDWLRIQLGAEQKKEQGYGRNRQEQTDKRRSTEITATKAKDYEGAF